MDSNKDETALEENRDNLTWRDNWPLLVMLFGKTGAAIAIFGLCLFLLAALGLLGFDQEWHGNVLELAITPTAVLISAAFAAMAFLASRGTDKVSQSSEIPFFATAQVYITGGVLTVGLILIFTAFREWGLPSEWVSAVGVSAATGVTLGLFATCRLGGRFLEYVGIPWEEPRAGKVRFDRFTLAGMAMALCASIMLYVLTVSTKQILLALVVSGVMCALSITLTTTGFLRVREQTGVNRGLAAAGIAISLSVAVPLVWIVIRVLL